MTTFEAPYLLTFGRNLEVSTRLSFKKNDGPSPDSLFWSPDGSLLAGTNTSYPPATAVWDARTGEPRNSFPLTGPKEFLSNDFTLIWAPDSTQIATGGDGRFKVFSIDDGLLADLGSPDGVGTLTRWTANGIQVITAPRYDTFFRLRHVGVKANWSTTFFLAPWRGLATLVIDRAPTRAVANPVRSQPHVMPI